MNDDLINRQAAIDAIKKDVMGGLNYEWIIKELPSVQPKQKVGRWIYTNTIGGMRYYGCTICANQECDYQEDGLCYADRIELDGNGVCLSCRFAEKHDKEDEE